MFARNWFGSKSEAERFQSVVKSSPLISWLATRPLFLSLLAHVWSERGHLPEQSIYRLYEQATNLLLGQWDFEKGLLRRYQLPDSYKKLALAVWAAEINSNPEFHLNLQSCTTSLAKWFKEKPNLKTTAELLDEIVKGSGILVDSGENRWEFSHHTLRSFFSANFLLTMPVDESVNLVGLSNRLGAWMEPVALAISALPEDEGIDLLEKIIKISGEAKLRGKIVRLADKLIDKR